MSPESHEPLSRVARAGLRFTPGLHLPLAERSLEVAAGHHARRGLPHGELEPAVRAVVLSTHGIAAALALLDEPDPLALDAVTLALARLPLPCAPCLLCPALPVVSRAPVEDRDGVVVRVPNLPIRHVAANVEGNRRHGRPRRAGQAAPMSGGALLPVSLPVTASSNDRSVFKVKF